MDEPGNFPVYLEQLREKIRKEAADPERARELEHMILAPIFDSMVPGSPAWDALPEYRDEALEVQAENERILRRNPDRYLADAIYRNDNNRFREAVGMEVNPDDALSIAAALGRSEMVATLLDAGARVDSIRKRDTPLYLAAEANQLLTVELLLEMGADPNYQPAKRYPGHFILLRVAELGFIDMLRLLIDHGANINTVADGNMTALCVATEKGNVDVINFLLERGASLGEIVLSDDKPSQFQTLVSAIRSDVAGVLDLLIDSGLRTDLSDERGYSSLMIAAERGAIEATKVLLARGVDWQLRSKQGYTAMQIADWGNADRPSPQHEEVAQLLKQHIQ